MSTHSICFCGENKKKYHYFSAEKKKALSQFMECVYQQTDTPISKGKLFFFYFFFQSKSIVHLI